MKAITTKYHGPTDTRGSRYSASDADNNRVSISIDHENGSEANHDAAAIALCHKMKWDGPLMKGAVKGGYVYVFDAHANRVRFDSNYAQERRTAAINVQRAKLGQEPA
jgi:hypothetical protein